MKIISYKLKRYAIADDDGNIIDDAQGWGYKTSENARKAMWYKFNGGKQKIQSKEDKRKSFFKQHSGLEQYINNMFEDNIKEIARGEVTDEDILDDIKNEFGIDMPKEYLHFL